MNFRPTLAVLSLTLVAVVSLPASASAAPLSVMSYNVNFGVAGDRTTLEAVGQPNADIVLLQETNAAWERHIRRRWARRYPHMNFHHCCRAGGLAILSKFPISESRVLDAPTGWFPAWLGVIDTPGGKVQALNVHLRPPISDDGSWLTGYFTTGPKRLQELRAYVAELQDMPTVVGGDFNEQRGEALSLLDDRGMVDAVREHAPNTPTWRWTIRGTELSQVLDHVFVSPPLRALNATVLEIGRSDHLPVVVLVEQPAPIALDTHQTRCGTSSLSFGCQ